MKYARTVPSRSEYIRSLVAENRLVGAPQHRVFFALHDHHILPHRFPEAERNRRDAILLQRNFASAHKEPVS